jgi:multidrug efflux pump subunit AcrB
MKFISIFLDRPRILFLTLAFILLSGISSVFTLPIQENPELAERWATVTISYPGATPERLETQVINDLEIKLREIVEIDVLESTITQGFSRTLVELEQSVPPKLIEETWSRVQGKIDQVIIPQGSNILLRRSSGPPITVEYVIDWEGEGEQPIIMMSRLAQQLKRKLSSIPATEKTAIYGEAEEEIVVEVDSAKMSSIGLTYQDISFAIKSYDNKKPVGVVSDQYSEFLINSLCTPSKIFFYLMAKESYLFQRLGHFRKECTPMLMQLKVQLMICVSLCRKSFQSSEFMMNLNMYQQSLMN